MKDFTVEELNFLCILRDIDRKDTINNIVEATPYIADDDVRKIGERLLVTLETMTDAEYNDISFDETFEE
ncbi:transposon-transfer assisting family protein [Ruminococcus flavefaciens]|uniref:transposon-transfer assisting family protein n=1 Tax=Ruminococcus flavefaciens TaxID=1265 RepID=UPI0002F42775|nr:transposon-transfer assisting family protein [Ruminococcus flavefaciens]